MQRLFATIILCFVGYSLWAQSDQITLQEAFELLEAQHEIKISYDPDLISRVDYRVSKSALSINQLMDQVTTELPLTFQSAGEDYYAVYPITSIFKIALFDSLESQTIENPIIATDGKVIPSTFDGVTCQVELSPDINSTVSIHVIGFDDKIISFDELLNGKNLNIGLKPITVELEGLIIRDYLTKGIDLDPASQNIRINTEDLPLLPGETDGDIFASISALPGITTPDNRPGNLFIRGSSTDQSLVLYNDIPIYHRGHYYGTISPYNPKMVSEVKVYRNGFDPSIGGRVGGAIKIDSKLDHQNSEKFGIGANTLYGTSYAKLSSKNDKWSVAFGARRSFPYTWNSPKLDAITEMVFAGTALTDTTGETEVEQIVFEDYSGGITFRPNKKHSISATSLYTRSRIEYSILNTVEYNELTNIGSNVKWNYKINDRWKTAFSMTLSEYQFDGQANTTSINGFPLSVNTIRDISFNESVYYQFENGNLLNTGINFTHQEVDSKYANSNAQTDEYIKEYTHDQAATLSHFFNFDWNSQPKIFAQAGLRTNYYSGNSEIDLAPRIFFNYFPTHNLTFKLSSGLYNQYLSQIKGLEFSSGGFDNELWQLANTKNVNTISGSQSMIGLVFNKKGWVADAEYYYKTTQNVTYYSISRLSERGYYFDADQQMYGLDLMLKKQITDDFSAWAAYSYSRSFILIDTVQRFRKITSQYSQPHVINFGTSWQKGSFKASLGWYLASGQYSRTFKIIQVNENTASMIEKSGDPNPFDDLPLRYPNVHQLNFSASYKLEQTETRNWSGSIGLSLINIYNQENQIDTVVRANAGSSSNPVTLLPRYSMGFAPNLMVIVEW
jgi:hypothetical protein